jgi:WhiB family transcriptional regulator, redox-sensing transcriptional regulator
MRLAVRGREPRDSPLTGIPAPHRKPHFPDLEDHRVAAETVSSLLFTGPLTWTGDAACVGQSELFFAPAGERPETRVLREGRARAICSACAVLEPCRRWAREHREYGFWGGESEEDRAAAGFRVDMPVGRVARYPKGNGRPVAPREPRVA